jgi:biopolymer transport protein ExbD
MAGIDVAGGGARGRKALDAELNMVPMIDLLMVTIAFLLVTAVWSHMSRLEGSAQVPGPDAVVPPEHAKALHVDMRPADKFVLSWREGQYVVRSLEVPHDPRALATAVEQEWRTSGEHTSPTDLQRDQAVLHTANDTPFSEMVAVMDAIAATRRPLIVAGQDLRRPRNTNLAGAGQEMARPRNTNLGAGGGTAAFALTLATQ